MIELSTKLSLAVQFTTGVIDAWGLTLNVPEDMRLFRTLLQLELLVQVIEFAFYVWLFANMKVKSNVTMYRYYDWMITTPTMLITLMALLDYSSSLNPSSSLLDFLKKNKTTVKNVLVANALMLYFGYLGEVGTLDKKVSVALGFIPFFYYYSLIYSKFIKDKPVQPVHKFIYWYFYFFWSLYGIAALLPYEQKNVGYNILDLFSKNFFGLFLVYILFQNRVQ